uniref:hypothetical protein n=1 Tax=Algoriphagus sp. TaxID=1872435 RepID=UPI004048CB9C
MQRNKNSQIRFTIVFSSIHGIHMMDGKFRVKDLFKGITPCHSSSDYKQAYDKSFQILCDLNEIQEKRLYEKLIHDEKFIMKLLGSFATLTEEIAEKDSSLLTGVAFFNLHEQSIDYHRVVTGDHTVLVNHVISQWIDELIWFDGIDSLEYFINGIKELDEIIRYERDIRKKPIQFKQKIGRGQQPG